MDLYYCKCSGFGFRECVSWLCPAGYTQYDPVKQGLKRIQLGTGPVESEQLAAEVL